ncbi:MAG: 3-hydroxyacyl-CoA dehydrogenase family protein [Candidatus Promineifilaceae bacterium]|nr:3-hydroxyacyl-CoA dehydrogenase family protein [Candidatus Promineifilaceae bacterium]
MNVLIAGETPFVEQVGDLCLAAGHDVTLFLVEDFLSAVESGQMMADAGDVEIAIEMHNESPDAKQELLLGLSRAMPAGTLVLSTAFPVSATQAAAWVAPPERVVGFGLIPPIGPEGLVELAPALQTSEESMARARDFWEGLGFDPIEVGDGPGLVRGRVVACLINEAAGALMEGVASAADIDRAMKLGTNYPHGPLEWGDMIGLDTVLGIMDGLFAEWGDDRYRPSPLLRRMVLAGRLGLKSGRGFYEYTAATEGDRSG